MKWRAKKRLLLDRLVEFADGDPSIVIEALRRRCGGDHPPTLKDLLVEILYIKDGR